MSILFDKSVLDRPFYSLAACVAEVLIVRCLMENKLRHVGPSSFIDVKATSSITEQLHNVSTMIRDGHIEQACESLLQSEQSIVSHDSKSIELKNALSRLRSTLASGNSKTGFEDLLDMWYLGGFDWHKGALLARAGVAYPILIIVMASTLSLLPFLFSSSTSSDLITACIFFSIAFSLQFLIHRVVSQKWYEGIQGLSAIIFPVIVLIALHGSTAVGVAAYLTFLGVGAGMLWTSGIEYKKLISQVEKRGTFSSIYVRTFSSNVSSRILKGVPLPNVTLVEVNQEGKTVVCENFKHSTECQTLLRDKYIGQRAALFFTRFPLSKKDQWVVIFPALFLGRQYTKKHPIRSFFFKGEGWFIPKTWNEVQEVVPGATIEAAVEYFATQPSMLEPPAGYEEATASSAEQ